MLSGNVNVNKFKLYEGRIVINFLAKYLYVADLMHMYNYYELFITLLQLF